MDKIINILVEMQEEALQRFISEMKRMDDEKVESKLEFIRMFNLSLPEMTHPQLWNELDALSEQKFTIAGHLAKGVLMEKERARLEEERHPKVVVTLPDGKNSKTMEVVHELIEKATKEIILLGYRYSEFGIIKDLLFAAHERGVRIYAIGDKEFIEKIRSSLRGIKGKGKISFYSFNLDEAKDIIWEKTGDPTYGYPKFHAKVIIRDQVEGLITSANFTVSGMTCNIEVGTRINKKASKEIFDFVKEIIKKEFVQKYENWY